MSESNPQDIVLQFYRYFDEGEIEQAIALLAPHCQAYLAGMPNTLTKDEFATFGQSFFSAFAQGQHQFDQVIVAGDKVITCGKFSGCHCGNFQGLPPTHTQISLEVMHIDRVENGQIVEHWGQGDALGMMQQLGIVFFPGPKLLGAVIKGFWSRKDRP